MSPAWRVGRGAGNFDPMELRTLGAHDLAVFDAFLRAHRDTSMFLRSNARKAGLEFAGQRYQATHVAGFRGGQMVGVVAHAWNGVVLLQAPDDVEVLARRGVEASGRPISGISGPVAQVRRARAALGLTDAPTSLDADERLYGLDLADLVVPAELVDGHVSCRAPATGERALLREWRHAYALETLGADDGEDARRRAADAIDDLIAEGNLWVALRDGAPAAMSAFNAALPDIVQIGGVYTPPALRGRHHARVVVAGSLQDARARGATRAVLFTADAGAARCYESLGFRHAGDYGLVTLRCARS